MWIILFRITGFQAVLRIHDILVWIWIRIFGSMHLTNRSGSGFGPCYFRHQPSRRQQKINFSTNYLLTRYFLKVHFHHFSKIKSQKEVTKQQESRFFLLFLLDDRSWYGSIPLTNGSGSRSRRPKNKRFGGSGFGSQSATLFPSIMNKTPVLKTPSLQPLACAAHL